MTHHRDVSFPAFAGIPAFMKSKFLHFYFFSARFGGFQPRFTHFSGFFLQVSLHPCHHHESVITELAHSHRAGIFIQDTA